MAKQQKLEKVLDLLLNEEADQATELLHQIIIERARVIYENIVESEESDMDDKEDLDEADEVGGDPDKDFTDEIEADTDEISSDEQNDGEAGAEEADGDDGETEMDFDSDDSDDLDDTDLSTEDRVEDLEAQLAELRAEFDALMDEELEEPQHADMAAELDMGDDTGMDDEMGTDFETPDFGGEEKVVGEVVATMFEKKKSSKLAKAPQVKDKKKDKKVDEETQFLQRTADTGQKGVAKAVGTGKDMPVGQEQTKSIFTRPPVKKDYGGTPANLLGSKTTGGEYGKFNGQSAKDDTPSDNVNVKGKNSGIKADTTPKYTGGKSAGEGFNKSPFTKKPA